MTQRYQDWPTRLEVALEEHADKRFRHGRHDCVLFAANVTRALTGVDHAAPWRGRYSSGRAARDLIAEEGVELSDLVTRQLGGPISPRFAQRGDVVLLPVDGGSLGICTGPRVVVPARGRGLTSRPLEEGVMAWRV